MRILFRTACLAVAVAGLAVAPGCRDEPPKSPREVRQEARERAREAFDYGDPDERAAPAPRDEMSEYDALSAGPAEGEEDEPEVP